ncbi:hypothetical protein ROHU_032178 [Labeo rohita]|uniref:Uncharacterized protein n=1 Tax=Labeo rohita TaxID=84645 RepID=A0A498LM05_LABRO|nr:hypothetical protein ROHU_032178 [Labeo rohita]
MWTDLHPPGCRSAASSSCEADPWTRKQPSQKAEERYILVALTQWLVWVWQRILITITRATSPILLTSRLGKSSTPGSGAA